MISPPTPLRAVSDGVSVDVWVVPGARKPGFDGLHDGAVRLKVAAPPEGGRANDEAARVLAAAIGGRRGRVVKGLSSRRKRIEVTGTDLERAVSGLRTNGVAW